MCQCYSIPSGDVIVCDHCASQMIEALNDLLPGTTSLQDIAGVMTHQEYGGMASVVDDYFTSLVSQNQNQGQEGDIR